MRYELLNVKVPSILCTFLGAPVFKGFAQYTTCHHGLLVYYRVVAP